MFYLYTCSTSRLVLGKFGVQDRVAALVLVLVALHHDQELTVMSSTQDCYLSYSPGCPGRPGGEIFPRGGGGGCVTTAALSCSLNKLSVKNMKKSEKN